MTTDEHRAAIAGLRPSLRRAYRTIAQHGPLTPVDLQNPYPLEGGGEWRGRTDGARRELRTLMTKGLIRPAGKRGTATRYAVTPPDEVETEARRHKRTPMPQRNHENGAVHARLIREYRRMEKAAGLSARAHWIQKRRRIVELTRELKQVQPLVFWKSVPNDELEDVWEQIVDLIAWANTLERSIDLTRLETRGRERIVQLRNTEGRSPEEAALFRRKADELEAKLNAKLT
jgi:hypothetical protein